MNETLLIILGVGVFTVTVVGVLIYFYSVLEALELKATNADTGAVAPRAGLGDA